MNEKRIIYEVEMMAMIESFLKDNGPATTRDLWNRFPNVTTYAIKKATKNLVEIGRVKVEKISSGYVYTACGRSEK